MSQAADIEGLLRENAPRALAATVRRFGDFAHSEDAVQEALAEAAEQWRSRGVPESPSGWLIHVAARRMTDRVRSDSARRRREEEIAAEGEAFAEPPGLEPQGDDSMRLILMCCHPALTPPTAIALTLRAVGGLTTAEIAAAFLVPEATMAQRVSRAKATIVSSGAPFAMPEGEEWGPRLASAMRTIYLIFNEGYVASSGPELARADLSSEAIRLARIVRLALPDEPEPAGLLALMLLAEARREARTDDAGLPVPLDEQDRSRWDRELTAEGSALIQEVWGVGMVGEYQVQAAVAALHCFAASPEDTDWEQIALLYAELARIAPGPMVELNRGIAVGMARGPDDGLTIIDGLSGELGGHFRLRAARGRMLELGGRADEAAAEYRAAAEGTRSVPERDYLVLRAARVAAG